MPFNDLQLGLKIIRKKAIDLTPEEIDTCYKLVYRIRPLYIKSGERWNRAGKLDELRNTPNLEYLICYSPTRSARSPGSPRSNKIHESNRSKSVSDSPNQISDPQSWQIIGYISFVLDDLDDHDMPTSFIYELHISPGAQGMGLGRQLIAWLFNHSPARQLTLRTFTCNEKARAFYYKLGFTEDNSLCDEYILYLELREIRGEAHHENLLNIE